MEREEEQFVKTTVKKRVLPAEEAGASRIY
jgi:hypothetical protein